jgi:hypothetical protein
VSREIFVEKFDDSRQKVDRRSSLNKIITKHHCSSLLATNYPGPHGRAFIRSLAKNNPDLRITLVDREQFKRDTEEDSLDGLVIKMPYTDIFRQLKNGTLYDLLDIDLFGGLSVIGRDAIEDNKNWKHILLTISDRNRSKTKDTFAKPAGINTITWATEWCERNNWGIGLATPLPYRTRLDASSPTYYTFHISR